jgi:restriction endonuclease bglII
LDLREYIAPDLLEKFEFYSYNHALEIITQAFPAEWSEIVDCLRQLRITTDDLRESGGNETKIPKKFDDVLYPRGWREIRISGDLHIKFYPRQAEQRRRFSQEPFEEKVIPGYIDGHNIDFLKNRIAFDLEWNSKDQTFDRDLLAMRTYYDCDLVSAGIIITRSAELNDIFKTIYDYDGKTRQWKPILRKYGASTTWMGKLTYRLDSRRNGGCPILAVGIRKPCITDWEEGYIDEHNPGNI